MISDPNPAIANSTLLDVRDVGISFGGLKAVQNFSLNIPRGRLHASSAPTAPARRPSSTSSPASTSRKPAPSRSTANALTA